MKIYLEQAPSETTSRTRQLSTFTIDGRWYGIDVMNVQEVTRPMELTLMRTAPPFIKGLINLRGQIATAIGLRELFGLSHDDSLDKMTVVCRVEDVLLSLLVDNIGDVIEVSDRQFEPTPLSIAPGVRAFMTGVYKTDTNILSVVDLAVIFRELERKCA